MFDETVKTQVPSGLVKIAIHTLTSQVGQPICAAGWIFRVVRPGMVIHPKRLNLALGNDPIVNGASVIVGGGGVGEFGGANAL